MRNFHFAFLFYFLLFFWGHLHAGEIRTLGEVSRWKDGDIIFQTSLSGQSKLIAAATHSTYTHCGIIFFLSGQYMVLEAVEPVRYTPLAEWIRHGTDSKFVVKRLKESNNILTAGVVAKMKADGEKMLNKHYDLYLAGMIINSIVRSWSGKYISMLPVLKSVRCSS